MQGKLPQELETLETVVAIDIEISRNFVMAP